ncbi:hypothetical protein [Dokdonella sp.]|uniref:hypothetical protein n=1 Tax=Dokdonella sp. TaxID=2291710 RepID=UPI003C4E9B67
MDEPSWRTLSRGRCFVYLLPCREEDTQKIGFARDPWIRMRAFHPQFFALFDLQRGALIETDHVNEARAIEARLKSDFAAERCVAPLATRARAGGKHEWFRGIDSQAMVEMQAMSETLGYLFHTPLAPWFREAWMKQVAVIRDWSNQQFEWVESLHFNADPALAKARAIALRNQLAGWDAIGIPVQEIFEPRLWRWFVDGFRD